MKFIKQTLVEAPAELTFNWHTRPGALQRLLPPWQNVIVHHATGSIEDGQKVEMSVPMGPFKKRWIAEHTGYLPGRKFEDIQRQGPFASWHHVHRFEPQENGHCLMIDEIDYELPAGGLGQTFGGGFIRTMLENMFAYRHAIVKSDVETIVKSPLPPQKILISGSSGMIGSALIPLLTTQGHQVTRLVRGHGENTEHPNLLHWDIKQGEIPRGHLEQFDAVIHLAGAGIADHRWTKAYKEEIVDSRVKGTKLLSSVLSTLTNKPKVFISASAIGIYGSRRSTVLSEKTESGMGFLAEVGRLWEQAADPAREAGIRVVHPRIGVVLSPKGGALKKLLTPFSLGLGGVVGTGTQYWSCISLEDIVHSILFLLTNELAEGPINLVSPQATTNEEFTKTLGTVLRRPTILPLPGVIAEAMLGEMANELLLASARVTPEKLIELGYDFRHPKLEAAFRHQLGKYRKTFRQRGVEHLTTSTPVNLQQETTTTE